MSAADLPEVVRVGGYTPGSLPNHLIDGDQPVVFSGLVRSWPAVQGCGDSAASAWQYLQQFAIDEPVTAYLGEAQDNGRFFYNDEFNGFNFRSGAAPLGAVLERLTNQLGHEDAQRIYVGSTMVDKWLPGFRQANDLQLPRDQPLVSFWLGNQSRISAHYDYPDNIACVVAGRRRFTLFPPEQVENLYVGPMEHTPSGQTISLVDFAQPDFDKFPKFAQALEHAVVAELGPGDALYIPSLWWHHVESHSDFNMLINYWWINSHEALGSPAAALLHAIWAFRDLPMRQKAGWQALLQHYVFANDEAAHEHIPEHARGCLETLDEPAARQLRAVLLNKLNQ
jgi:hypothetical protein